MEREDFQKIVGKHMKECRQRKNLSQNDVAASVNNNSQNIYECERGKVNPLLFWVFKLCQTFEISQNKFHLCLCEKI
jgi:DNA-binding XRE family transcriptional regulator